jgi:hypothetical protein
LKNAKNVVIKRDWVCAIKVFECIHMSINRSLHDDAILTSLSIVLILTPMKNRTWSTRLMQSLSLWCPQALSSTLITQLCCPFIIGDGSARIRLGSKEAFQKWTYSCILEDVPMPTSVK